MLDESIEVKNQGSKWVAGAFDEAKTRQAIAKSFAGTNFSPPKVEYEKTSNRGISDKFKIQGLGLGKEEWLTGKDLDDLMTAFGIKKQVDVAMLSDPRDLGAKLHFRREERAKGNTDSYRIPLVLNLGSVGASQGAHWTQATLVVDPKTTSIQILYKDSLAMTEAQKEMIKKQLKAAVEYEEKSLVQGVEKHFQAFKGYKVDVDFKSTPLQPNGWSCGYHALYNVANDPYFSSVTNDGINKLRSLKKDSSDLSSELRTTCYEIILKDNSQAAPFLDELKKAATIHEEEKEEDEEAEHLEKHQEEKDEEEDEEAEHLEKHQEEEDEENLKIRLTKQKASPRTNNKANSPHQLQLAAVFLSPPQPQKHTSVKSEYAFFRPANEKEANLLIQHKKTDEIAKLKPISQPTASAISYLPPKDFPTVLVGKHALPTQLKDNDLKLETFTVVEYNKKHDSVESNLVL
jgi:hypothetical protein